MNSCESHYPAKGRYEQMLASSAIAAICAGADNLILSWNTAAERLFGYSAQLAVGQPLTIIVPERYRAAHQAGFARAAQASYARLAGCSVEILALHANGSEFPVEMSLSMWLEDGQPMFGALIRDITDRYAAQQRLEHLAHYDILTSLPNRNALYARIAASIAGGPSTLLLLDLDSFKDVNDTLGHSVGDDLLVAVAARLLAAAKPTGFVARLGGDEFAILLSNCVSPLTVNSLAKRIFRSLQAPFELSDQSIFIGTSIGIAMSPSDASSAEQLLSRADLALNNAKSNGGGIRTFFSRVMQNASEQRHRLGIELRRALAKDEFEVWYQPQVSLKDKALLGVEALLRWRHPEQGLLSPQLFIKALEESAIAEEVGDWILEEACSAAAGWKRAGVDRIRVGVNLFPAQLRSDRLFHVVSSAIARHGLAASQVELEITENTILRHTNQSTKALQKLKALGVGVAFDDFGTGFASLSFLQKYPVTRLKIDRSFVADIDRKTSDAAIVSAVIGMAKTLGLNVIAEGVETKEQEEALMALRCEEAQGYLYGRPMPQSAITKYLQTRPRAGITHRT